MTPTLRPRSTVVQSTCGPQGEGSVLKATNAVETQGKGTGLRAAKTVETQIKGTFLDAAEAVETQGKGALRKATKAKAVKAQGKCSGNTRQRQWNHKAKAVETQSNGSGNTAQSRCRAMVPPPAALNAASAAVASFTMYSRGNISGYALRPADRAGDCGDTTLQLIHIWLHTHSRPRAPLRTHTTAGCCAQRAALDKGGCPASGIRSHFHSHMNGGDVTEACTRLKSELCRARGHSGGLGGPDEHVLVRRRPA